MNISYENALPFATERKNHFLNFCRAEFKPATLKNKEMVIKYVTQIAKQLIKDNIKRKSRTKHQRGDLLSTSSVFSHTRQAPGHFESRK